MSPGSRSRGASLPLAVALAALGALGGAAACGHRHADHEGHDHGEDGDVPAVAFTRWTATHEVFAEHPPFVIGDASRLAAHVTRRAGHRPITAGVVVAELRQADGAVVTARAEAPASAGLFRPALVPTAAGPCTLTLRLEPPPPSPVSPAVGDPTVATADRVDVEDCVVHASAAAVPAAPDEPAGRITLLKDQAWTRDFAVDDVGPRDLTPTLRASGEIRATAGREARLTAPVGGRVVLATPPPVLGMSIERGQLLGTVAPRLADAVDRPTLVAELRQLRAEVTAAEGQVARDQRLAADGAIPARQLDEARTRLEVARARLAGAEGRMAQFDAGASGRGGGRAGFQLRAPVAGTLVELRATSGQSVEAGELLFTVVDLSRVWVHADIFEPDIARVEGATRATFRIDGHAQPFEIAPPDGGVVTVGKLVDRHSRTVPMIFEVGNPEGRLRVGSFATVFIATGAPRRALAVPDDAIVDDAGREVVYVQAGGESFERRPVTTGIRSGGWTELVDGVAAGERVVTRGAYAVKLAGAGAAVPSHGHAH